MSFKPTKTGRLKVRLKAEERDGLLLSAQNTLLPELKTFINEQPLKDRVKIAWRVLLGRF